MDPRDESFSWRRISRGPDLSLAQAGADAERMLADRRVVVVMLLFVTVAAMWVQFSFQPFVRNQLFVAGFALLYTLALRRLVHRHAGQAWIGFATSLGDVALVTLSLLSLAVGGRPDLALQSTVLFPLYYLVIVSTALRYDARITLVATLASLVVYPLLVLFIAHAADWLSPGGAPPPLDWSFQVGKMVMMAASGVVAVSLIDRSQRMSLLSTRDPLTGLLNRRFLDERLAEESERARRGEASFAVALVDVDRFKQLNDVHGHGTGDAVLRAVASVLTASFRATDIVARYGGDEFALLLPHARAEELHERFEAARQRVAAMSRAGGAGVAPLRLSLSVGLAVAPQDGDTPEALLQSADRRLYAAKAAGRDCVVGPEVGGPGQRAAQIAH